ncbi:MAG TPA: serine/threonine-protein kinase [Polyangiaceae bacterium]|jgi:serine/threonine protein kinase|nr:serine/threonine-protein kinase [Polyangiaceae bacterium]
MALREDITERANARIGSVLKGKWRLDAVIGIGGMASVYAATHRNQARVAIKMLHPEVALDAEVTQRFLREGYVANAVGHPGTVTVLDDDVTEDNAPFLVMELLVGQTLDTMLAFQPEGLSARDVLPLIDQLLDVLAAAHEKGIVHRDLKPENLFLTSEGRLKVLDFGIARLRELSQQTGTGTRAGSVLGTPAFMAPEQALGRWNEVDHRTDIWAVGATAFTMLSGRFVHEAETIQEQLVISATRPAPRLREVAPIVPEALAGVVDRALAFQRTDRFSDARVMRGALRQASATIFGEPFTPPSLRGPTSARVSHADDLHGATLVAPFEVTSAITGRGQVTSTGQPVTRTTDDSSRPSRRGGLWVAAVLGLGVLGVGVAFGVMHHGRPNAELTPAALPAGLALPVTTRSAAGPAQDLPAVAPIVLGTGAATASASSEPAPASTAALHPTHLAVHALAADKPHTPPGKVPAQSGQANGENPFDRRH